MKLYAIRHTRVDVKTGICYGKTDVGLAAGYLEHFKLVRKRLPDDLSLKIYSSPLSRCLKLARYLFPGAPIITDKRLTELDFGNWEMQSWDTISQLPLAAKWFNDYVNTRCPGGESFSDQLLRTGKFLDELLQIDSTNSIVITHGGNIRAMRCLIDHLPAEEAFRHPVEYGECFCFNLDNIKSINA